MLIKQIWCMECKRGSIKYDFRKNAKQEIYCEYCKCKHVVRPYKNGRVSIRNLGYKK